MAGTAASDYDGTNDYALRGADLTGNADTKEFLLSIWIRLDGGDGADMRIISATGAKIFVERDNSDKFRVLCKNAAGTTILDLWANVTHTVASPGGHVHLCAAADLANNKAHLFITDVDREDTGLTVKTNDTIDFTVAEHGVGAATNGNQKFNGCFSEIYLDNVYLDISVEANLRKFISASLKAVDLGTDGSIPIGSSPLLYAPDGDPSDNKGTGGNYTITGALSACSDSPGAGGFSQTVAATAVGTVSLTKLMISARTIAANAVGAVVITSTFIKGITIAAAAIGTAVFSKSFIKAITVAATAIGTAAFSKILTTARTISATAIGSASIGKVALFLRTITASAIGTATVTKVMTALRTISASAIGTATISRVFLFLRTISAAATGVASLFAILLNPQSARVVRLAAEQRVATLEAEQRVTILPEENRITKV